MLYFVVFIIVVDELNESLFSSANSAFNALLRDE
jgi:hypothetical protein